MRRGNLTEGSNPSLSATTTKSPKIGNFSKKHLLSASNYDTFNRKKDTYNIYKVSEVYYFRTRIDNKLYRKSLKTKNLKKALLRAKLLKSMKKEEQLQMFKFEDKDYKLLFEFEYDDAEELERILEIIKKMKTIEKQQEIEDKTILQRPKRSYDDYEPFTFEELELEFLTNQKKVGKVSESSFKNYNSTFVKLKTFFRKKDINKLDYKDLEEFRDYLMSLELSNKTINNLMSYVNMYLEFALNRRKIEHNPCKSIQNLKEEKSQKKNFTDEEVIKLLQETKKLEDKPHMYPIFLIGSYTGMRFNEILDISEESLKTDSNGIKYIDIIHSKTPSGIRRVPLHKELENFDFKPLFSLSSQEKNKYNKEMLRVLYSIIPKEEGKTFHTLRGTFINRLINKNTKEITIIQEIVGHSKGDKSITCDTYSKEFDLRLKKEIINSIDYF